MKTTALMVVGAIALSSTAAFAFNGRSMVTLSGYETGDRSDRSLDLYNSTGTTRDVENDAQANVSSRNIALNYTYAITDAFMVGGIYKAQETKTSGDVATLGDKSTTWGLQVIYNLAQRLTDTTYVGIRWENTKQDAEAGDDGLKERKFNTWALDVGHRFHLGKLGGMSFNYSPSASLATVGDKWDQEGADKLSRTNFTLNFVKFDVLF